MQQHRHLAQDPIAIHQPVALAAANGFYGGARPVLHIIGIRKQAIAMVSCAVMPIVVGLVVNETHPNRNKLFVERIGIA